MDIEPSFEFIDPTLEQEQDTAMRDNVDDIINEDKDEVEVPEDATAKPEAAEALAEPDDAEPEVLPDHACAYCSVHAPGSVVHCNTCGKWFCNSRGGASAAHIVTHLVRSRHKEVSLHKESPLGDAVLECYTCGCRNVFLLGFVRSKSQNVVVLLCRVCVESSSQASMLKDADWNIGMWETVVKERMFLSWLASPPTATDVARARKVTREQIHKMEDMWKEKPTATFEEIDKPLVDNVLTDVVTEYEDAYHYQRVFVPLIKLEADDDKRTKELQTQTGVKLTWRVGPNGKNQAFFYFSKMDSDVHLMAGDELLIKYPPAAWECVGQVLRILPSEEVCVELRTHATPPDSAHGYCVEYVWKSISFDRMIVALKKFTADTNCMSEQIYRRLLGHDKQDNLLTNAPLPRVYSAPGLPELNHSQVCAVKAVLQRPLSLIQGPPGTGKTVTSATIVYHFVKAGESNIKKRKYPVLVCAPSNVAVDQLTAKIHATGVSVVRLSAKSRESIDSSVDFLTLHKQIEALANADVSTKAMSEYARLAKKQEETGLTAQEEKSYNGLKRKFEHQLLQNADVVCCTCVGAGDPRLSHIKFRYVLVDEATQAKEPECLIPLVCGAYQVVLVGDHCQLGPVIMAKAAAKAGLTQSMFERLIKLGVHPIRLQVQYRMHPLLSTFPSNEFYEGSLQNGVTMQERTSLDVDFPWTHTSRPMLFWHLTGNEEISASGTSYLNRTEAAACEKVVTQLMRCGVLPAQIGVITPYEGQRAYIVTSLIQNGPLRQDLYKEIEVASVDAFQGREKDYVILSCVRSNDFQGIGFLKDPRRLNVAITRSRYGLIIMGNARVLARQQLWMNLIMHFKTAGCLVEGTLTRLKQCMFKFAPVKQQQQQQGAIVVTTTTDNTESAKADGASNYTRGGLYGSAALFSKPDDV